MPLRPIEWELTNPLDGQPLAIIRMVRLGARRERYYRSVTANPDPAARRLVGYWGRPEDAECGTLAIYEHGTGRSLSGGDLPARREVVPQKPPPTYPIVGYAAPVQVRAEHARAG